MFTNIIVWNTQYHHITKSTLYGKHTIIEQQTGECLRISQPTGRKCLFQGCHNLPRLSYRADNTFAIAIQLIQLKKFLHLVVVSHRIWIYHLLWSFPPIYIISEIIDDHITIEHLTLSMQSILRKTIVIIPRFHLVYHRLNIACCRNTSHFLVISKHLAYFLHREAQHLIELWLGGDMPANIEPTRHIVQGHRTDTCDENTFKHTLELLEDITVEAIGMGDCPIYILTLLIEHSIGEIVIFIDNQIERKVLGGSLILKQS